MRQDYAKVYKLTRKEIAANEATGFRTLEENRVFRAISDLGIQHSQKIADLSIACSDRIIMDRERLGKMLSEGFMRIVGQAQDGCGLEKAEILANFLSKREETLHITADFVSKLAAPAAVKDITTWEAAFGGAQSFAEVLQMLYMTGDERRAASSIRQSADALGLFVSPEFATSLAALGARTRAGNLRLVVSDIRMLQRNANPIEIEMTTEAPAVRITNIRDLHRYGGNLAPGKLQ